MLLRQPLPRFEDIAITTTDLDTDEVSRRTAGGRARRALAWGGGIAAAALIGLGSAALLGDGRHIAPTARVLLPPTAPPLPPMDRIRPLTAEQAAAANALITVSAEPLETASPFVLAPTLAGELWRSTALDCMTAAVYYEAASEVAQGQRAVAQVVLNRVRHPAFPKSVCGVVYQGSERSTGCQFSFTCDGSLARRPSRAGWDRAAGIAAAALSGVVEPSVGTATHYHTVWILPYWADSLTKLATVGAHIFYRWPGFWGKRAAFTGRYSGEAPEAALAPGEPAADLTPAGPTDLLSVATGPATRLLPDETRGQLLAPTRPASGPAPIAADRHGGTLIADEDAGVLQSHQGERRNEAAMSETSGQAVRAP